MNKENIVIQRLSSFFNYQNHKIYQGIKWLWILFITSLAFIPLLFFSISIDLFGLFGGMPPFSALENPENDLSSELITSDGESLGRYYRYNRSNVKFEELSEELVTTLIASEDIRFYEHSGLDLRALMRVFKGVVTFSNAGGGYTLTQQLAKNLYTQNQEFGLDGSLAKLGKLPQRVIQKLKEWIISYYLEKSFTKREILTMYLNTSAFSNNAYGIKVAAETYFGTSQDSLNFQESAVLVGILQAITRFNPTLNPDASLNKRNMVLGQLVKYNIKDQEFVDSLRQLPIDLSRSRSLSHTDGMATYFRSYIGAELRQWASANGYDIYEDGLKIYVTLDSRMQRHAEEAMQKHMASLQEDFFKKWKGKNPWVDDNWREIPNYLESKFKRTDSYKALVEKYGADSDSIEIIMNMPKKMRVFSWNGEIDTLMSPMDSLKYYKHFLHTGFMAMDPKTGQVKAWVGGINSGYFQFDHVKQGTRQPGSTFKPFVYGLAMMNSFSPCEEMVDTSPQFALPDGKYWRPVNSNGTYGDGSKLTIRQAMARSINSVTAELLKRLGPENVVNFAHQVGIESSLDPVPSICLGTSDVSLFELVGAYSTFVNQGMHTKPYYISKIEDKYGNVIYTSIPETKQAIDAQTAYKIIYLLRGGVEEKGGTSIGLSWAVKSNNEIGGKTGTTNNASDGWYMGVTEDLVAGCWVGGEERNIHFRSWADGSGARTARPIWDLFMQKVYSDSTLNIEKKSFTKPAEGVDAILDCEEFNKQESDSIQTTVTPWDPVDFN